MSLQTVHIAKTNVVSFDRSYFIGILYDDVNNINTMFYYITDDSYLTEFAHTGTDDNEKMVWTLTCQNRKMCDFTINAKKEETRCHGITGYRYSIDANVDYFAEFESQVDLVMKQKYEDELKLMIQWLQRECEEHDEEILERECMELQQDYRDGKC